MSAVCPSVLAKRTGTSQRSESASVCAISDRGANHVPRAAANWRANVLSETEHGRRCGESRVPGGKIPHLARMLESLVRHTRLAGVAQLVEQLIRNQQVVGSSPTAGSKILRSIPDTWVTVHSGGIGNTFGPKGLSIGSSLQVSSSK